MYWLLFLVCTGIIVVVGLSVRRLRRWFLLSGCLGVLVALTLIAIPARYVISPKILLVLWPSSIAGIADPSTLSDKLLVALFEFGGNFILYGVVGTLVGLCFPRKPSPEGLGAR
jgi:uncharacterized membrane protein HdeD (DUF308 family)